MAVLRAGALLVATAQLTDATFRRTVVYLLVHGEDGTVGVVLNRRTETAVHNVLPGWSRAVTRPQALYAGGPVQTSGSMCLGVAKPGVNPFEVSGVVRVADSVVLVDLDSDPELIGAALRGARIFAGHAGWSPGQLADEVAAGAWYVLTARPEDIIAGGTTDVWFEVLRRQGFPLAWQAYRPQELRSN